MSKGDNLKLWKQVCETDDEFTTDVTYGRKYTAIDPMWQTQQATAIWGPYGDKWGIESPRFQMIETTIGDSRVATMMLEGIFFYPSWDGRKISFPYAVDMRFKPGDDCCKKLLTMMQSKCLSKLGFSADIYLGKFEDNAYVAAIKEKFGDQAEFIRKRLAAIRTSKNEGALDNWTNKVEMLVAQETISPQTGIELFEAIDRRREELAASPPASQG